ncbi:MAG: hypothetical protein JXQ93_03320 [Flavobacteriaceae bacterium]
MKIIKIFMMFCLLTIFNCTTKYKADKQDSKKEQNVTHIYAESKDEKILIIGNYTGGNSYFKIKGSNYSEHFYGSLKKEGERIIFYPKRKIGFDIGKNLNYGENTLLINFNDKKAFEARQGYSFSYKTSSNSTFSKMKVENIENGFKLLNNGEVTIKIESKNNELFEEDTFSLNPVYSMLFIDSEILDQEYLFEIADKNSLILKNYFDKSVKFNIKKYNTAID